jgi:hypothetical protein
MAMVKDAYELDHTQADVAVRLFMAHPDEGPDELISGVAGDYFQSDAWLKTHPPLQQDIQETKAIGKIDEDAETIM